MKYFEEFNNFINEMAMKTSYLNKTYLGIYRNKRTFPNKPSTSLVSLETIEFFKNLTLDDFELVLKDNKPFKFNSDYFLDDSEMNRFYLKLKDSSKDADVIQEISEFDKPIFEMSMHRTHITDLPSDLKGIGLGYKLYKKLILQVGHLWSEENVTSLSGRIWYKLSKDKDFYTVYGESNIDDLDSNMMVVIDKTLDKSKISVIVDTYKKLFDLQILKTDYK